MRQYITFLLALEERMRIISDATGKPPATDSTTLAADVLVVLADLARQPSEEIRERLAAQSKTLERLARRAKLALKRIRDRALKKHAGRFAQTHGKLKLGTP
jgi:hypothetical protein